MRLNRNLCRCRPHPVNGHARGGVWGPVGLRCPVHFDGAPPPVTPAPLLGEHTAEVFADRLGMSAADLKSLRDEGVV